MEPAIAIFARARFAITIAHAGRNLFEIEGSFFLGFIPILEPRTGERFMNRETEVPSFFGDILRFLIKISIAAAVAILAVNLVIGQIEDAISDVTYNASSMLAKQKVGGSKFWSSVEKQLDDIAASDLPADKKRKLTRDVKVIVARYRPILDAIQDGLKEKPPSP